MAKAGLAAGFSTLVNPYSLTGPDFSAGLGALQDTAADAAMMRSRMTQTVSDMSGLLPMVEAPQQPAATQAPASSAILYNPVSKEFAVAGQRIASDDATKLLQSEALIGQPTPPDVDLGPGWEPVTTESYQRIIEGIKNPSFGTMFGKGFEIGTQNLKTLYGSALQSVTGGEYGGGMVKSAETELAKLQPYQRDVAEGVTADWFATSLGQQGPMILESIVTALAGAAVGSAAGGPGGTAVGTLAGLFGKKAVKEKILDAAAKYNAAKAAGVALNSTPELVAATKVLKQAGATAGAVAGSFLGNEVIAAGDIYQEGAATGTVSPAEAWIKGVPYAALDLLPEVVFLRRVLRGGRAALPKGATLGQRATEYGVKRFGAGLAVGGLAEGLTETGQEAIVLQAADKDMASPEAFNRYLNSFAAGFAVGGLMGGAANLRSRPTDPTNLLDTPPAAPPAIEPTQTPPAGPPIGTQYELFPEEAPAVAGPPLPQTFAGTQERPTVGLAPPEVAPGQLSLLEPTQLPLEGFATSQDWASPTLVENTQAESYPDFSRFAVPGQELDTTQVSYPDFAAAARASQVNPAQGAFQFAEPAPSGIGFTDQQLPSLIGQRLLEAQQAQQAANLWDQRQAVDKNRDYELALAQQQLQLAPASEMGGWDAAGSTGLLPAVEARPTQPTQLVLPDILNQPRPTRAEKLKRSARPAAQIPEVVPATPQELEAAGQMRLFDGEGEATVAAAKGAGLKRKRPKPKEDKTTKQAPPTGRKVDLTVAAKKRAEEAKRKDEEAATARAEARKKAEDALAKKRAAKKPGELIIEDDGIEGREVAFTEVPNGNSAFQYAVGKVEADGGVAVFRRPASDRGTYGGWRVETDVNKLIPVEEVETVTAEEEALDAEINEIEDKLLGLESDGSKGQAMKYVKELYKRGVISEASLNDAQLASKDRDFGVEDIVSAIRQDITDYETEKRNALQKQSPDEVSARSEPGTGEGVGSKVRRAKEPTGARKLKAKAKAKKPAAKPVPEEQVAEQVEEEVTPAKKSEAAPAAATEEQVSEKVVAEPSEPVMIQFSLNGATMTADGREMLRLTNEQIEKHTALLKCLKG